MLGVVTATGTGEGDRLLRTVALRLQAEGLRVVGAVQFNRDRDDGRRCDMDLHVLTGVDVVRISQDLGLNSRGCRLDAAGLERVVGLVGAALQAQGDKAADLLIVNKFGKQEAEGRGFRPLIGQAMIAGIPVLTAVKDGNRMAFDAFADGLAEAIAPDVDAILAWARTLARAAQPTGQPA
ncbi:MAG: DUF2478 domain-containing protein [Gemmobacter sp.]|nr:DUF2478 domain-containing protein [Gemmobacter sp.]